jgi:hypothetical protein
MSVIDYAEVIRCYQAGEKAADIAKSFAVSEETISDVLRRERITIREDTKAPENKAAKVPGRAPELPPVPAPPKGNRSAMHGYYERNRTQILDEYAKYGFNATKSRWRLSTSTLSKLIKTRKNTVPNTLPPVPVKPPKGNNAGIKRYYEANNAQILEELKQIGEPAIRERWAFSKRSWAAFRQANGLPLKSYKKRATAAIHGTYISFPPFNDKWAPEVQVKWLELYKEFTTLQN